MSEQLSADLNIIQSAPIELELLDGDLNIIQKLDDEPNDVGGLTSAELKAKFDESGNIIKKYINEKLIPAVLASDATEAERTAAEQTRQSNEETRKSNEAARVTAETSRAEAEALRKSNETTRGTNEGTRKSNEAVRVTAEGNRATAEGIRATAETARVQNETERKTSEASRASAETARANAETQRAANETARQQAETQRKGDETARQSAENARNFWEDYSASKAYAFGNKVASAGSSYLCIKPCTGIAPPNAEYWRLIAAKGNDGKGAPSDGAPKAAGTANAGVLETYSRSDHVHPKEVSDADRAAWNGKQGKLTGTAGQFVGFDADGNAVAVAAPVSVILDAIHITTPPNKTAYKAGETFNTAGMVVKADYSNGTVVIARDIVVTGWNVTPSGPLAAGTSKVTVQYTENGITKTAEQAISVTRTVVAVPAQSGSLTYTGSAQSPTWSNYDSTKMTLGGATSGTNAGSYNATFTLKDTALYCWPDGTLTAKTVAWSIGKAAGTLSLSPATLRLEPGTLSGTFTIETNSTGAISVENHSPSTITVTRSGKVVTVTSNGQKSGTVNVTVTVAGDGNHTAPAAKSCTVTCAFVSIYGVQWDGTSTTLLSRTDDAAGFTNPVAYMSGISNYGSPFDAKLPWSGMVVSEDSAAGKLVAIPKFWYKLTQSGNGLKIQIADAATDGFSVSPAHMDRGDGKGERDVVYIGRYHCRSSDYKSYGGSLPKNNITRSTARSGIHAIGSTVWQSDFLMAFTIWLLYIVEYANWDSQAVIGYGCGNNSGVQNMGYTDSMPYHTGTTASARTTYGATTQYRNIEGLWDNCLDWMDGCYYNSNGMMVILNPSAFSDSSGGVLVGKPSSGWISALSVKTVSGLPPLFIASGSSGSDSTYVPDSWNYNASYSCLFRGGDYGQHLYHGMFRVYYDSVSYANANVGCRLQKLP